MQFDCIRIYGPYWREVGSLLTNLFEGESSNSTDGNLVRVSAGPFSWELRDGALVGEIKSQEFRIVVETLEELKQLQQRSEFLSFTNPKSVSLLTRVENGQFILIDGNGARWVFANKQ